MPANTRLFESKTPTSKFVVKNISPDRRRIRIFNYPIAYNENRDLLNCADISEADIRASLLKGQLLNKIRAAEIRIIESTVDLIQFDDQHKQILQNAGITTGLEAGAGGSGIPEAQHKVLRHLVHLAEGGGPFDGFSSGAYRETVNVPDSPLVASVTWYASAAKTAKILEKNITYSGVLPITIEYKVYDTDGMTVLATSTDTITYANGFEVSRLRSFS